MKRVKLFCGWGKDENFLQDFVDSWGVTKYKDMEFVLKDWTHAVIFGKVYEPLFVAKENAIGFTHEPRNNSNFLTDIDYMSWLRRSVKRYFVDDYKKLPKDIFTLGQGFISNELGRLKNEKFKHNNNKIAIIASWKTWRLGHQLRHRIIEWILNTNMDIDIYGNKLEINYRNNPRVKGSFHMNEDVYPNYKYIIAIESDKTDFYVSEKFFNCIAYGCIPIYWGANMIRPWYGNCCITLDNNFDNIKFKIQDVYNNPDVCDVNIEEVKNNIFNSVQYAPEFIWRQFESTN